MRDRHTVSWSLVKLGMDVSGLSQEEKNHKVDSPSGLSLTYLSLSFSFPLSSGSFPLTLNDDEAVLALATDSNDQYLLTGDTVGIINIFDISHYCIGEVSIVTIIIIFFYYFNS